jgi:hypothetical protein
MEQEGIRTRPGDADLLTGTKVCGACNERKPVSEFSNDRSSRDGRRWRCKTCDNAYRAARRASVELARRARRKLTLIAMFGGRCVECGESDQSRLHFDHVDPETKVATEASARRMREAGERMQLPDRRARRSGGCDRHPQRRSEACARRAQGTSPERKPKPAAPRGLVIDESIKFRSPDHSDT